MEKDKETKATEEREGSQVNQNVVDFGSAMTKTAHGTVYTLAIIGQIEGHTAAPNVTKTTQYEHMLPLLAKLEESREVDGILFLLNTVGGDVEAGLAIAELIAGLTKPTAAIVLGGSHSIGVPLAVAAQRSFAVPSAAMTIHPVRMSGTVIAAPQTYNYFQRLQERIVAFVAGHSRISADPGSLSAGSVRRQQRRSRPVPSLLRDPQIPDPALSPAGIPGSDTRSLFPLQAS